jgi:hypothetical protein
VQFMHRRELIRPAGLHPASSTGRIGRKPQDRP